MKSCPWFLLACLLMSCGRSGEVRPAEQPAAASDTSPAQVPPVLEERGATLQLITLPDLSQAEPAVAEQIRERHAELGVLLAEYSGNPGEDPEADRRLSAAYGDLGRLFHAYKLRGIAIRCYQNALLLLPETFDWCYYLGILAQEAGESAAAIARFQKALEIRPGELAARLHLAQVLLEQNLLEEADAQFVEVLETAGAAYGYLGRGRVAALRGEHKAAIRHFEAALARQPIATNVHYDLAQSYRQLGDLKAAESHLKRFGGVRVTFPDPLFKELDRQRTGLVAYLRRAGQAILDHRFDDALAEYEKALEIAPDDIETRKVYGLVLAQRDLEAGLEQLREARRLAPDNASVHLSYGQLLLERHRAEEALEPLKTAVRLAPKFPEARLQLAAAHQVTGHPKQALEHYGAFLERVPDNVLVWLEHARLALELGHLGSARRDLEQVLELEPKNLTARVTLADILGQQGHHHQAAARLTQVIKTRPEDRDARLAEAEHLLLAGAYTTALERLEEGHTLLPEDPELTHALARLLAVHPEASKRDPARALQFVETAFERLRSPYYAETMAMALAAAGRHQEAVTWQEAILAEATQSQDPSLVTRLRTNLGRYRQSQPAANPWSEAQEDPP